jgi:hypothetical protein
LKKSFRRKERRETGRKVRRETRGERDEGIVIDIFLSPLLLSPFLL